MPSKRSKLRTTRDTVKAKAARVLAALSDPANHRRSNRDLGEELQVDEGMVRKYRTRLGLPKLKPGTGEPVEPPAAKTKPNGKRAK